MEKIEWKSIAGFEGFYEVSNYGAIKSLRRGIELSQRINMSGYKSCTLSIPGVRKTVVVHQLVFDAFCGDRDKTLVIDHINSVKTNNRAYNLRQIPTRENTTRGKNRESNYRGVRLFGQDNKWGAEIQIEGKRYFLGLYDNAEIASIKYETALTNWIKNKVKPYTPKEGFKICRVCNKELPITDFHTTKTMKGNPSYKYNCKACESAYKKQRYYNSIHK